MGGDNFQVLSQVVIGHDRSSLGKLQKQMSLEISVSFGPAKQYSSRDNK